MGHDVEVSKKIREINMLNKRLTFNLIPAISAALSGINRAHNQLMDKYAELVELSKKK